MTILLNAIYRYPIKGFTPQKLSAIDVLEGKPLPWDRAFAIENGESGFDRSSPAHLSKVHFLMLMKQPELAALKTAFEPETGALTISKDGRQVASGNLFDPASLRDVLDYLATYCNKPLRGAPRLLHADGFSFTDSKTQDVTLINLASVRDISERAGADLDPLRFRGNFYIEGAKPWQEHDWVGKDITIGGLRFTVRKRTQRCAATNANPATGERDQNIPKLLMTHYDHCDCGIHLMPRQSGPLQTGASLTVL
nr:MOSC N-terminal beta barrel domain-containing protein [uncultured Cohaesibacter sp.]